MKGWSVSLRTWKSIMKALEDSFAAMFKKKPCISVSFSNFLVFEKPGSESGSGYNDFKPATL